MTKAQVMDLFHLDGWHLRRPIGVWFNRLLDVSVTLHVKFNLLKFRRHFGLNG